MEGIDYKRLAQEMLELKVSTKAAGSTPNAQMGHGNGGLFSNAALEKPVFSAFVLPNYGLSSILPTYPTVTSDPLFGILTGVTDTTGSEPTGLCDDPPYAGLSKLCQQSMPLGRFSRRTRTFELDAFGKLRDRGEHLDLVLYGNGAGQVQGAPTFPRGVGDNILNNEAAKAFFELAVAWSRDFAPLIYTGNPTNNTWQGGYKEFNGLDILINTGYRDAVSGTACAAADSLIRSFGDVQVQADGGVSIVNHLTQIMFELQNRARQFNLAPTSWVIVMRPQLFHILTSYWACSYLTYRCEGTDTSNTGVVDTGDAIAMRDRMRAGSFLTIDGQDFPVVQDDSVAETNVGAGVYESVVYFVPMTVLGGTKVTYMEYFDYSTPGGFMEGARAFAPDGSYDISDNGRFAWHFKPPTNWCVEVVAKTEPRLLLRTPMLAARLTDVRYVPYVHERDWDPDGTYFVNGGGISQAKTTYSSPRA